MSAQLAEILEYKNESFYLIGNPLYKFLEKRKDIEFEFTSTSLHRGYQGTWTINNNKLFLIKLHSSNYSIENIFNTQAPVLAEWFSGNLEVGIGIHKPIDHYFPVFDYYLVLKIERGEIFERKIVKRFPDEPILEFGKYKGFKFKDIIYGKLRNGHSAINNYIDSVIKYFSDEQFNYSILIPPIQFNNHVNEFLNKFKLHTFKYQILDTCVDIGLNHYSDEQAEELKLDNLLSQIIGKILSLDFEHLTIFTPKGEISRPISESCFLLNPDISYLIWALSEVDFFYVPPYLLDIKYKIKKLQSFEITRINYTRFSFKPIFEPQEIIFPLSVKEKNKLKFQNYYNNLKFDAENDYFVVDEANDVMMIKFGFYLSDNITNKDNTNTYINSYKKRDDLDRESFGKYSGTYAQSTEWLSDNFIDDVLDGDPDAYWNID